MWDKMPQNYANHARIVPPYHYGVLGLLTLNLLWTIWMLIRTPSLDAVVGVLLALALLGLAFYTREFALAVQNRVIRLETRLRLQRVLPEDLRSHIDQLSLPQLIALRFAGDGELPDLVRDVLELDLRDPAQIKERIVDWQPDYLRC